jgi:hypothetical protein
MERLTAASVVRLTWKSLAERYLIKVYEQLL